MAEAVGFVGVGRMGAPMVRRLLAHGYEVGVEIREKGGGR